MTEKKDYSIGLVERKQKISKMNTTTDTNHCASFQLKHSEEEHSFVVHPVFQYWLFPISQISNSGAIKKLPAAWEHINGCVFQISMHRN